MPHEKDIRGDSLLLERLKSRRARLILRDRILASLRATFRAAGFVEVETPLLLATVAPEEHIVPIRCADRFLATSPELQMKELVAAGFDRIFQITRSFRAGERGSRHVPEFTILEWYRTAGLLDALRLDLEMLLSQAAHDAVGSRLVTWQGRSVDFSPPYTVIPVREVFLRHAGWDPVAQFDADRFDLDLVERVEPHLGRGKPEILAFYPLPQASLARPHPRDPQVALRLELYVEGMELANGFMELSDASIQEERFRCSSAAILGAGRQPPPMPDAFLATLPHLPDCVGIALGIDRLVMLLTDASDIDQVRTFTPDEA
ncbi:MAG: EF-P lysine aminoacylase GenX [Deltaproteobacteria bacterium]|nr:EF-P lysine aminoacylase GenX [Deltaproteobacteria bacterium]